MQTQRWQELRRLFDAVCDLPAENWRERLRALSDDDSLIEEVLQLLGAQTEAFGQVARPLGELLADSGGSELQAGDRLDAWLLVERLASGGMGTVFLAKRDAGDGVQRVALKLLHGLPTQAANRRLARERGLLASLDHPQIARHIDGGVSESGQPYLVMDYVEGASLHEYLAATPGTTRQRLRLFLRLCEAVQHAHQRLVLHRDLKPSNIVVRADGAPVLLDFGIATLMAGDDERPALTATVAFTPAYSAPEQRRGERATTATDVFGLGALLFD
ncbi:serine/threonine-protein kinase, partial [Lysobacter sp. 2RAB21]